MGAQEQLRQFNGTVIAQQAGETCYHARKILTCALAFPICYADPYVSFPCKDICRFYYQSCGAEDLSVCNSFPTADCIPLSMIEAQNGSHLLSPAPFLVLAIFLFYVIW